MQVIMSIIKATMWMVTSQVIKGFVTKSNNRISKHSLSLLTTFYQFRNSKKYLSTSSSDKENLLNEDTTSTFISKQVKYSNSIEKEQKKEEEAYLVHQEQVFDNLAKDFANDDYITPMEIRPLLQFIANKFLQEILQKNSKTDNADTDTERIIKVADIGCGTGILFPYLATAFNTLIKSEKTKLQIYGVDLSSNMLEQAQNRIDNKMSEIITNSNIEFILHHGSFITWAKNYTNNSTSFSPFDGIIMNAVFGNFFNLTQVLSVTSNLLHSGIITISHPLGASFQKKLHEENPQSVKYPLPSSFEKLVHGLPLQVKTIQLEYDNKEIYYASLEKVQYQELKSILKFRGMVSKGYGRGSKTLGIPTANLPESLFSTALQDISTGVYFGYAMIENSPKDEFEVTVYKTVVNIGYSPTFAGKENKIKIIEAHLILDDDCQLNDFYDQIMRLELIGFIRPEQKFTSLDELKTRIFLDIDISKHILQSNDYFRNFGKDAFLLTSKENNVWVGESGGNTDASWEFKDWENVVEKLEE